VAEVVFDAVTKEFGATRVVSALDLHVRDGELMVLVGPSGCGKSTALRMLAGLEEITSGTISIDGRVVNGLAPRDRDIAMVFQSYALYPHMTVRENLGFGIRMRGGSKSDVAQAVENAASSLGITHLLERRPAQLSGGQRQRVAVGRAIVRDPKVFLFDEPLSNLDAKLRGQMRGEIIRLQQRLGTTAVYVTHDQVEAMTMAHRIAVMLDGRLQQLGTPMEVYEAPRNVFVASFIGTPTINLLPATVDSGAIVSPSIRIPLPPRFANALSDGRDLTVGIRPEQISITDDDSAAVRGAVDLIETLGHESLVHIRSGQTRIVAAIRERVDFSSGDSIGLAVDGTGLHLFDSETGERIEPA
jgi:multiple sugar transport system ATP-binding protein